MSEAGGGGGPAVSVVIPTRDRWPLLADTLASVLAQEHVALEAVIVDDGSTAPPPAARPFDDPRVRIVRNERSLGVAGARNRGIESARGGWIAFLDDDDVWSPAKLRSQLDAAGATGAAFAYAAVVLVTTDRGAVTIAAAPPPERLAELLAAYNAIPAGASNVVVRTDRVRTLGGFDPDFGHLADWDLWIRLAADGRGAACEEPLVGYRLHPASMRSTTGGALAELGRLDRKHRRSRRPPRERIWFYRWLADGQLLAGRRREAAATSLRGARRCRSRADAARAARILLRGGRSAKPTTGGEAAVTTASWLEPILPATAGAAPVDREGLKRRLRLAAAIGLDRLLRLSGGRIGLALVYHGIHDGPGGSQPAIDVVGSIAAPAFRAQLDHVRANYRLVPAAGLRAAALARRRGQPFPLAITFDDDLRSHVDVALPMLRRAGVPATFFLTGASLDGPASFWWERLERALAAGVGADLIGTAEPGRAVATVEALPPIEREELSSALLERLGGESEDAGLRAEHVAVLARDCEVGFHTRMHERLPGLGDEALAAALREGVAGLERAAGSSLRSLAYPYGEADARVAAAARTAGFDCGYTTRGAAVRADADPFLMGRLYPSEASIAHLASQLSLAIWRAARGR
ncbi:MAG TPA: glycosyltransferase [Solirubrobacterales bacterium]|nr:glycosyltransferase [Solirubrobacterales bacterium]